jgi:hypothetical protein
MSQGVIMGWSIVWLFVSGRFFLLFHSTRLCLCGADFGNLEQLSQLNYIIDTYLFAAASALAATTVIRR